MQVTPNRASSGRGYAPRRPWRQKFRVAFALRLFGRSRPAADAIVGRGRGEAESPAVKPPAAGESEHATKRDKRREARQAKARPVEQQAG